MDRRQALRNIGWGSGALVATPTILSLLQSCNQNPGFSPVFLSQGQGHALKMMVDLMLPSDPEVPGAVAMGVHKFMDLYWNDVLVSAEDLPALEDEFTKVPAGGQQKSVRNGFTALETVFQSQFGEELASGESEEFRTLLSQYLKAPKETQEAYSSEMWAYQMALKEDPNATASSGAMTYGLLTGIRGLAIWAWKRMEFIGEDVLWYDPVPGVYDGCIPISEAGNGKVMSL